MTQNNQPAPSATPPMPPAPPPGGTGASGIPGPKVSSIASPPSRAAVGGAIQEKNAHVVNISSADFEANLSSMLDRAIQISKHDRDLALALFRVHLDRAEELDKLPLSMPVASVISDNTGATLKALEIAQKSGDRLVKIAEILANARKADEANAINAYKAKAAVEKNNDDSWGDEDLPDDNRPA